MDVRQYVFDRILADQARIKYTEIELAKNGKNPVAIREQSGRHLLAKNNHFFRCKLTTSRKVREFCSKSKFFFINL